MSLIRIPSRNGLLWITGVTTAAVVGIIEAPLAIAFAAVPVINQYLNPDGGVPRSRSSAGGSGTAGSRRSTRGAGTARRGRSTTAKRSTARRSTRRGVSSS